jgi:hypothetical protein
MLQKSLETKKCTPVNRSSGEIFVLSMALSDDINKPTFEKTIDCVKEATTKADLKAK